MKRVVLLTIYIVFAFLLQAEEADSLRFALKARTYSGGMGLYQISDPYLSPLPYSGEGFRIEAMQRNYLDPENRNLSATQRSYAEAAMPTQTFSSNAMLMFNLNYSYGMHYHFRPLNNTVILAGGSGELNLGSKYISRNVNNPFSLDLYGRINASGEIQHHFYIKNRKLRLQYGAEIPIGGVVFAPSQHLSYYEISLTKNLAESLHFASIHNGRVINQYLNFDIPFNNDALRLSVKHEFAKHSLNRMVYKRDVLLFSIAYVMQTYKFKNKRDKIPSNFINVYD